MSNRSTMLRSFSLVVMAATWAIALALLAVQPALGARAALAPGNPTVEPHKNSMAAPTTTSISITYDQAISSSTVSTGTFAVHAMQTGRLAGTYSVSGGTIQLTPLHPLKIGELVQASATTGTLSISGEAPISGTVWQFWTAVPDGAASFSDSAQYLGPEGTRTAALGDLDGDGDLDALAGMDFAADRIWLNDGAGHFQDSGQAIGNAHASQGKIALGDLDGDGDLDAFITHRYNNEEANSNEVWVNDGAGQFADSGQRLGSSWSNAVALGDLDGDGDLDAFVCNNADGQVWLNDGAGNFADSGQSLDAGLSQDVALGDLDGDGDLDAVVANSGDWPPANNRVWLNDGLGAFVSSGQALGVESSAVALGDVDQDGDLDALIVPGTVQTTKVWRNNGSGIFSYAGQELDRTFSQAIALGDLDSDGDIDVVLGNTSVLGVPNDVWLNDGAGSFSFNGQQPGFAGTSALVLGDLDDNGTLDVLVACWNQANEVWLNARRSPVYLPLVRR